MTDSETPATIEAPTETPVEAPAEAPVLDAGRSRNRRGEGRRLREDILAAATTILEDTGSEEAVTLRSVARAVGIAAPSIYAHFADREAIVNAVVDAAFEQLHDQVKVGPTRDPDPVAELVAGCLAYARFALDQPERYRILFDRRLPADAAERQVPQRLATFTPLVDALTRCVRLGRSASTDPFADATAIWCAMHGAVTLRTRAPAFPWPPIEASIEGFVRLLGHITPA